MKKISSGILLMFLIVATGIKCVAQDDGRSITQAGN